MNDSDIIDLSQDAFWNNYTFEHYDFDNDTSLACYGASDKVCDSLNNTMNFSSKTQTCHFQILINFQTNKISHPQILVQGDPNQKLKFLLAVALKLCIFDPMLVKPKCV